VQNNLVKIIHSSFLEPLDLPRDLPFSGGAAATFVRSPFLSSLRTETVDLSWITLKFWSVKKDYLLVLENSVLDLVLLYLLLEVVPGLLVLGLPLIHDLLLSDHDLVGVLF